MRIVWSLVAILIVAGCVQDEGEQLVVSAASSLVDAFAEIERDFEAVNRGVDVTMNHAGSAMLGEQILEGAPVDVFAPADAATMSEVITAGAVTGEPAVFAVNSLQIVVPAGNPAGVEGLEDFADPALLIGLCAEGVPCGDLARSLLAGAGITPSIDTAEPNARALLAKVEAGELDAGLVYVTDVRSGRGAVDGIDTPQAAAFTTEYPIAALAGTDHPALAAAFIEFVISEEGRSILAEFGFETP